MNTTCDTEYRWSDEIIGLLKSVDITKSDVNVVREELSKLQTLSWGRISRFTMEQRFSDNNCNINAKESTCRVYRNNRSCGNAFSYSECSSSNSKNSSKDGGFCEHCIKNKGEWTGVCSDCKHEHKLTCECECCGYDSCYILCFDCAEAAAAAATEKTKQQVITTARPTQKQKQQLKKKKAVDDWSDKVIDLLKSVDNANDAKAIEGELSKLLKLTWGRINRFTIEANNNTSICRHVGCGASFNLNDDKDGGFCEQCMKNDGEWTGICSDCCSFEHSWICTHCTADAHSVIAS